MVAENLQSGLTKKRCVTCNREFTEALANCPDDNTALIPVAQDPWVGKKLNDHYEIISVIGHGGMGVVYKAKHDLMDRFVAVKMLLAHFIADNQSVRRFQHEAKAASKLNHPNIITLHDYGVSPTGQPYLVMDYLEGISLSDIIKSDGKVGVDRGVKIFSQVCQALDHAHHQGLVHRDLKPGNVMLTTGKDRDSVKVVDFGVAKIMGQDEQQRLTQTGEICGSPVYMSPEQCIGQKLDARSDIYSMGVLMYEALTGQLPLLGKTMVDTMSKHIGEKPASFAIVRPDLYIPERLEQVVFHCLEKEPSKRPQSMAELYEELLFAIPQPGKTSKIKEIPWPNSGPPKREKKYGLILAFAFTVLVLAAFAFMLISPVKKPVPKAPAALEKPAIKEVPAKPSAPLPEPKSSTIIEKPKPTTLQVERKVLPKAITKMPPRKQITPKQTKTFKRPASLSKPSKNDPWADIEAQSSGRKYQPE